MSSPLHLVDLLSNDVIRLELLLLLRGRPCLTLNQSSKTIRTLVNIDLHIILKRDFLAVCRIIKSTEETEELENFVWNVARTNENLEYIWENYHLAYMKLRPLFSPKRILLYPLRRPKYQSFEFTINGMETSDWIKPFVLLDAGYNYFKWFLQMGYIGQFEEYKSTSPRQTKA